MSHQVRPCPSRASYGKLENVSSFAWSDIGKMVGELNGIRKVRDAAKTSNLMNGWILKNAKLRAGNRKKFPAFSEKSLISFNAPSDVMFIVIGSNIENKGSGVGLVLLTVAYWAGNLSGRVPL